MIINMEYCRLDQCTSKDVHRPALNCVYIDVNREVAYAANGYVMAVVPIKVDNYEESYLGPIAVPQNWFAWLMGSRKRSSIVVLDHDQVLTLHRGDRRIAVDKLLQPDQLNFFHRAGDVVAGALKSEVTERIIFSFNLLRSIVQAGGGKEWVTLAVTKNPDDGETERNSPLIVRAGEAGAILMPGWSGDRVKELAKAREILQVLVGEEEDEPSTDETVAQATG